MKLSTSANELQSIEKGYGACDAAFVEDEKRDVAVVNAAAIRWTDNYAIVLSHFTKQHAVDPEENALFPNSCFCSIPMSGFDRLLSPRACRTLSDSIRPLSLLNAQRLLPVSHYLYCTVVMVEILPILSPCCRHKISRYSSVYLVWGLAFPNDR